MLPPSGYAQTGASGRTLSDGCVDGWSYSNGSFQWKQLVAAGPEEDSVSYPEEYTDGFFILNEDWFGHRNGSLNWVASDGTVYYDVEAVANGLDTSASETILGSTTQFGQIYGGNFFISSKQGTRFVVLDAKTLKTQATFDAAGVGDGRDVCAVSNDKVYVGGSSGIIVYDVANSEFGSQIEGLAGKQAGMMVRVGRYVFAVEQGIGVRIIDPASDSVVETIENANVQGLTVTKDGYIWCTLPSDQSLMRINPATLDSEVISIGKQIVGTWGGYRPDYVCSSYADNALFVASGSSFSPKEIYKFVVDGEGNLTEDTGFRFTIPDTYPGLFFYCSPRVNLVTGDLLIVAMTYSGPHFLLLYIDPATGEVKQSAELTSADGATRYWFPSVPVMPDNAAPVISLEDISFSDYDSYAIPVAELVSDADNLSVLSVVDAYVDDEDVAVVAYDGLELAVAPVAKGVTTLHVSVNSNGKTAEKEVKVTVGELASVSADIADAVKVYPSVVDNVLNVEGAVAGNVAVYNVAGSVVASFDLSDGTSLNLEGLARGYYLVRIETGGMVYTKKIMKM